MAAERELCPPPALSLAYQIADSVSDAANASPWLRQIGLLDSPYLDYLSAVAMNAVLAAGWQPPDTSPYAVTPPPRTTPLPWSKPTPLYPVDNAPTCEDPPDLPGTRYRQVRDRDGDLWRQAGDGPWECVNGGSDGCTQHTYMGLAELAAQLGPLTDPEGTLQ